MVTEQAKRREEIVRFFKKYGLKATIDAYKVSKSTIYAWSKKLKEANRDIEVLNPKSKVPKNKRKPIWDYRAVEFIKKVRLEYGDIGKEKIRVLGEKAQEKA